jgi:uncharacterized protein (TIGR00369 family)
MTQLTQHELLIKFAETINQIPFNRILGLTLNSAEDPINMSFAMSKELIGNYMHGILHGGVISSVLDMAGGTAAMLSAIRKREGQSLEQLAALLSKASTISLHVDYMQPGKGELFNAKAWVQHAGNKITFTRMELHNQENILIASATATYLIG